MVDVLRTHRQLDRHVSARASLPSQQIFQRDWKIYRKFIDNNYLFHREAYACLRSVLSREMSGKSFSFLDIACGDAGASIDALRGAGIVHYEGIDLSRAALDIADANLLALGCPFVLKEGDFAEVLSQREEPVDFVWIGLSLHHLRTPEKRSVMRAVRSIIGENGRFLIYENTSPDGENREGWLERWQAQRPFWTAFDAAEWDVTWNHVSAADFPETVSGWRSLAEEAGFKRARELFVAPSDLFRLYSFE
ncbi:MAG: class I SAM-dependent methyltransferase [Rhizobiales bacterium]|nr:class I SAM-dependent methyltransferase [Hyphomicrobiales bacterium]